MADMDDVVKEIRAVREEVGKVGRELGELTARLDERCGDRRVELDDHQARIRAIESHGSGRILLIIIPIVLAIAGAVGGAMAVLARMGMLK